MRRKLELEPDSPGVYGQLGDVYLLVGRYQEAAAQFQKAFEFSEERPQYLARLGYAYGLAGRRVEAIKVLQDMALLSKRRYVSACDVAAVYAGIGEKDAAFGWLEKSLADRSRGLVFLKWDYKMASLRSDPRYAELVDKVGLPR